MHRAIVILALLAVLAACAARPPAGEPGPPPWVDGTPEDYPVRTHLVGRGEAAAREVAADRARAELAKTFRVRIESVLRDEQRFTRTQDAGGEARESSLAIERVVRTETDNVLAGVRIAEVWRDPDSARFHVLAVLERQRAALELRRRIVELDEATAARIEAAREAPGPLAAFGAATRAVELQRERTGLQHNLQVVALAGRGVTPAYSLARLEADRRALAGKVVIRVVAPEAGLADQVAAAVGGAGFRTQGKAGYRLEARLDIAELGERERWYWLAGTLEVVLRAADGRVLGRHEWRLRQAATRTELARQRLRAEVVETLDRELEARLIGFAGA
jgi:hypothetical protein